MQQPTFLYSNFDPLPDHFFSGYCFIGSDFIYGDEGAKRFTEATASTIDPGEDGCYIIIRKTKGGHIIGADFKGYKKLFVYQNGSVWAVSNSFMRLVCFARDRGQSISVDDSQLAAWFVKGSFGDQLSSFATAVREIRLVPSSCCLLITLSGCRLDELPRARRMSYPEALHTFMSVWLGRLKGLLLDPTITVLSDLTGGKDTRAVLSLFLAVAPHLGDGAPCVRYVSLAGSQNIDDLSVAKKLCSHFSLPLNEKITVETVKLDAKASYLAWQDLCIGVYAPIYFPTDEPSPVVVRFSGGGGESHRPFYPRIPTSWFLERQRKYFQFDQEYFAWKEEVLSAIRFLQQRAPKPHPLILHYREFRDRSHVGRGAQYYVELLPLGSKFLQACSDAYQGSAEDDQILYDIMQNLAPGLADMPYDKHTKLPSEQHKARLMVVDYTIPNAGLVFCSSAQPRRTAIAASSKNQFVLLKEALDKTLSEPAPLHFGQQYRSAAERVLDLALKTGRFSHATDAAPIHHLLLANVVSAAGG